MLAVAAVEDEEDVSLQALVMEPLMNFSNSSYVVVNGSWVLVASAICAEDKRVTDLEGVSGVKC